MYEIIVLKYNKCIYLRIELKNIIQNFIIKDNKNVIQNDQNEIELNKIRNSINKYSFCN